MTEIFANPFTFWHMFEIAVLVILAIALARIAISMGFWLIMAAVGFIGLVIAALIGGSRTSSYSRRRR